MKFNILNKMDILDSKAKLYFVFNNEDMLFNDLDLDSDLKYKLKYMFENNGFKGKGQEVDMLNVFDSEKSSKVIFAGLGDKKDFNMETLRRTAAKVVKLCNQKTIKKLDIPLYYYNDDEFADTIKTITEIALLTDYSYDRYLSEKCVKALKEVNFIVDEKIYKEVKEEVDEGLVLGEVGNMVRDLINEPANIQSPGKLSKTIEQIGKAYGFEVEIIEEDGIKKLGMESFLQVSKASIFPPKLIVMRYFGNKESDDITGLVGKAITYDSGGMSLKSGDGMINMKMDMAGAASVVGAIAGIAKLKHKVNVIGVAPACENMLSNTAYRPGDIIGSMAGKTILINSTDSEGRLTLIDGIHYAIEKEKVTKVVDIGSLTGATVRFLGRHATGVMSNHDGYYKQLERASEKSGEMVWRFPILEDCRNLLKSDVADLNNSTRKKTCGAITASMFIQEFVQDMPWIHMDIAGTCWFDSESHYHPKGATGIGTKTLYYLLKNSQ